MYESYLGGLYHGKVIDQSVDSGRDESIRLNLTVQLYDQVKPVTEPLQNRMEVAVSITLLSPNPTAEAIGLKVLKNLGIESQDTLRLHPDHPECISLVTRDVNLKCITKDGKYYWNFDFQSSQSLSLHEYTAQMKRASVPIDLDSTAAINSENSR